MEKSIAGLIGAVGALAAAGHAQAAPVLVADAMRFESYADLLKPIPNAVAVRQALAEVQAETPAQSDVMTVQYYRHHHHHHHHRYYRRRYYHHHHHHHHHHGFYR